MKHINMRWLKKIFIFCTISLLLWFGYSAFWQKITLDVNLNEEATSTLMKTKRSKHSRDRTDAVILLTMMRSGSSIVGSVFDQRSDVIFLYEPLFPFGERPCDAQAEERVEVLRHITRCQLDKIAPLYDKAFNRSKREENSSRCKPYGLCFPGNSAAIKLHINKNAEKCLKNANQQNCPSPVDFKALTKYCKQSLLRVMKVIYLCKLEWLVPLLEDEDYNIKVIHLVRDPRSTVNSRLIRFGFTDKSIRGKAGMICEQLVPNVKYADEVLVKSKLKDKYLRVRFEDFASKPMKKTQEMFDFVGINMNDVVKNWISKTTSSENDDNLSQAQPFGRFRNPEVVLSAWRKKLTFAQVVEIQKRCPNVFQMLGYQVYKNEKEYNDTSKLHFIPE